MASRVGSETALFYRATLGSRSSLASSRRSQSSQGNSVEVNFADQNQAPLIGLCLVTMSDPRAVAIGEIHHCPPFHIVPCFDRTPINVQ